MKKRFVSILLTLCMLMGLFSVTAFAGKIDIVTGAPAGAVAYVAFSQEYVTDLQDAFNGDYDGCSVILIKDYVGDVTVSGGNYSFYLNGYTMTGTFKVDGGAVNFNGYLADTTEDGKVSKIQNTGLDGEYPIWLKGGNINVGAGIVVTATAEDGVALCSESSKMNVNGAITVTGDVKTTTGGVLNIVDGTYDGSLIQAPSSSLSVAGGSFSEDPSSLLKAPYQATLTGGKYVVSVPTLNLADLQTNTAGEYLISTPEELLLFRNLACSSGKEGLKNTTFKLTQDINMAGIPLGAAGDDNNRFAGTFDGCGFTIKNVSIAADGVTYVGFFGQLNTAEIKNVTFENLTVIGGDCTGGLSGHARNSKIAGCEITGTVDITGGTSVAGILGSTYSGSGSTFEDCEISAVGTIRGKSQVGGIVGTSNGNVAIKSNLVEQVAIEAKDGSAGAIAGQILTQSASHTTEVTGNVADNVTITVDQATTSSALLVGSTQATGTVTLSNNAALGSTLTVAGETKTNLYDDAVEESGNVNITDAVAEVDGTPYTDLKTALKAIQNNSVVNLLKDVTITDAWDCRYTGAKFLVPVTINGNGHTLKFTGKIDDKNWNTVFRFEDEATVKNLTIDVSEATDVQRCISSKLSINVENCKFIGNGTSCRYGVIFGEGAGSAISEVEASVSGSEFSDMSYGVSDNRNEQDAKSVSVTDSSFDNAKVLVSASDEVTFTGNEVNDTSVSITSYTDPAGVEITAKGNDLTNSTGAINLPHGTSGDKIDADSDFEIIRKGEKDENGNTIWYYEVKFIIPEGADVEVRDEAGNLYQTSNGLFILPNGNYTYSVDKFGYFTESDSFIVNNAGLTITVELQSKLPYLIGVASGAAGSAEALFSDVDANAWYYDAVQYVLDNGLMNGVGEDTFAPNGTMTRAMVWTVLGRMAGQDFDGTGANWYVEAQNWAIVNGISDGTNPNGAITREELVTMLWRFVDAPVAAENALQWYGDEASVADWAADAMNWAVNRQIIEGANWNLNPQATALRCQVAAILMRYCG